MKNLILILSFLYSISFFSQEKLKRIHVVDTFNVYDFSEEALNFYFKLPPIKESKYNYHFRYKSINQVVDLYSNDTINFKGFVLSTIGEYKNYNAQDYEMDYLYEKKELETSLSSQAGILILNKINNIPTDKEIKGWNHYWTDCPQSEFILKFATVFTQKEYSCYYLQNTDTPQIKLLENSIDKLDSILTLKKHMEDLTYKLKKGKGYFKGATIMYLMTDKESKEWNESIPINKYLNSKSGEIDKFLKETLDKANIETFKDCPYTFRLIFSKEGRLKKISMPNESFFTYYKKDYRQYRKTIEQLFKNSVLNLEYGFSRDLEFTPYDGYVLIDNTPED